MNCLCIDVANVLFPAAPKVDVDAKYLSTQQAKGGSTFILHANFTGIPTPKVTWYHGDTKIDQSPNVTIATDPTFSTFTVSRCTPENAGKYRCEVSNKVGSDNATFDVVITGPWIDSNTFDVVIKGMWIDSVTFDVVITGTLLSSEECVGIIVGIYTYGWLVRTTYEAP